MKNVLDIGSVKIEGVSNTEFIVTRDEGKPIREYITNRLLEIPENTCLFLDFQGVKFIDLSGSDEIIAKLVSRIKGQEFGRRYICLINLTMQHLANIPKALDEKGLSIVTIQNGKIIPEGAINTYLIDTFQFVVGKGKATARELADERNIPINLASTRLLNLYKEALVMREEDLTNEGNKQFIYKTFLN